MKSGGPNREWRLAVGVVVEAEGVRRQGTVPHHRRGADEAAQNSVEYAHMTFLRGRPSNTLEPSAEIHPMIAEVSPMNEPWQGLAAMRN